MALNIVRGVSGFIEQIILLFTAFATLNTGVLAFQSQTLMQAYAPADILALYPWLAFGAFGAFVLWFTDVGHSYVSDIQ